MKIVISSLLILHGLIVAAQGTGSFGVTIPNEVPNPGFVSWWPMNLGRSWLFSALGLEGSLAAYRISGALWLIGGIALVAAGLGLLGWIVPTTWWRDLAIAGGGISLFMLALYFHPLTIIGTASSMAVLVALLWAKLPPTLLAR